MELFIEKVPSITLAVHIQYKIQMWPFWFQKVTAHIEASVMADENDYRQGKRIFKQHEKR